MTFDSPGDLAAVVAVVTAILAGILYLIKAQTAISREFKRNGGSSTKDVLWRIERDLVAVRERLDQHIDTHNQRD